MTNALKKELTAVATIAAGAAWAFRFPKTAKTLATAAAGLWLTSLPRNFDYEGKHAFITGGSRGLGLSLAWNLIQRGASVTLVARDSEELGRARKILRRDFAEAPVRIEIIDVTDPATLEQAIKRTIEKVGKIDLLINNAGSIQVGPLAAMEREDFESQLQIHLMAVVEATRIITPYFEAREEGGRILNICSFGGKVAVPHMLPYDVSKFALAGFSQGATAELASKGIRITTAFPSVIRTGSPIQAKFKGDSEHEYQWFATLDNMPLLSLSADTAAKRMLNAVADGRTELVLSVPAKARLLAGAILPETMNAVSSLANRMLPKNTSHDARVGADVDGSFESSRLLRPLSRIAEKERQMYNQQPPRFQSSDKRNW